MLKLCLFSPVKGVVVKNGTPVEGAVIERTCKWNWSKKTKRDETTTDAKGEFSMPGIYSWRSVIQLVPHEPVIHQQILIKYEGETYSAWHSVKHEYGEYGELEIAAIRGELRSLGGKPISLLCELTKQPENRGGVWGYTGLAELR